MRFDRCLAVIALCSTLTAVAHAGPVAPQAVVKRVKLVAHIGDSLFVTKPDQTAYGLVELTATGSSAQVLTATVPIRLRTTDPEVNVTLLQPLRLSNGRDDLANVKVVLKSNSDDVEIAANVGRALTIGKLARDDFSGFDEVRQVKISAKAPEASGASPVYGSYRGNMVLIFEPTASAGREPAPDAMAAAGE